MIGSLPKMILTVLGALGFTALASLLWYRFTPNPRPAALETVRNAVVQTPVGLETARVLGVSDESNIEPMSLQGLALTAVQGVAGAAEQKVREILVRQAVRQLTGQFDALTPSEQTEVREVICRE